MPAPYPNQRGESHTFAPIPDPRRKIEPSRTTNDALAIMEAEGPLTTPPRSSMSISDLSLAQYTMVGNNIAIPLPSPHRIRVLGHRSRAPGGPKIL
jgi:hypothetical protein